MANLDGSSRDLALFEVSGREVTAGQVLASAEARGVLEPLRRTCAAAIAAEALDEREGIGPGADEVERRTDAFRYARRLLTAEETESWLARRGLAFDDLERHVRREAALERRGDSPQAGAPPPVGVDASLVTWLLLRGELGRLAEDLARRLVVAGHGAPPDGDLGAHARLEAALRAHAAALATERARRRTLDALRVPLTRVDLEVLSLRTLDAGREALQCLRHDGMSVEAVAAVSGAGHERASVLLRDLDDDLRGALLSAVAGDVVGPFASDEAVRVARVAAKCEPDLADADVSAAVDAEILDADLEDRVARGVRWLLRDERDA
jgi:hypothetical protein